MPKDRPIFISCSTNDIKIARLLRAAIEQLPRFYGYIARDESRQFEYPSEKIAGVLEQCYAYVIICTRNAIQSPMTNQEFGFFFSRWRREGGKVPILLVKSTDISEELEGFAYAREPIWMDQTKLELMVSETLWNLHSIFPIDEIEVKCRNHIQRVEWPKVEDCRNALDSSDPLVVTPCQVCGNQLKLSPLTFLPISILEK